MNESCKTAKEARKAGRQESPFRLSCFLAFLSGPVWFRLVRVGTHKRLFRAWNSVSDHLLSWSRSLAKRIEAYLPLPRGSGQQENGLLQAGGPPSRETCCVSPVEGLLQLRRRSSWLDGWWRGRKVDGVEEGLDDVGLDDGRDLCHLNAAIAAAKAERHSLHTNARLSDKKRLPRMGPGLIC